jgi:hypothetical protein
MISSKEYPEQMKILIFNNPPFANKARKEVDCHFISAELVELFVNRKHILVP